MARQSKQPCPKLVILHIPKTAGTSFREIVRTVYRTDAGFWYEGQRMSLLRRLRPIKYDERGVQDKIFLGGHKPLRFYPRSASHLYCATLRHPVDRIKSLFSYYTRPFAASGEKDQQAREELRKTWLKKGIVPDSLVRSIEQCRPFKHAIQNQQCAYLSRRDNTFDDVLKTISHGNFVIGHTGQLSLMIDSLAEIFEWPETPDIMGNVSRSGQNDDILEESGAMAIIQKYCAEDQRLYDFIVEENKGLFKSIPDRALFANSALRQRRTDNNQISRIAWKKISLQSCDKLSLPPSGETSLEVTMQNNSRERLDPQKGKGIFFAYKLLDSSGQHIPFECVRTPLLQSLEPGHVYTQSINIVIPAAHRNTVASIRLSMLQEGKFWVEAVCSNHAITISLCKQGNQDRTARLAATRHRNQR